MIQTLKTEALIVHSMRWSDTSKIVHFFTAEKGYVKAIAKGAMRAKSPLRGVLENLNHVEAVLSIRESRGLQIVSQADIVDIYSNIREDLDATAIAYSMLELIRYFVHYNEEAGSLFHFTTGMLASLNATPPQQPMPYLIRYLLFLSEYLGFGWNLDECRECGRTPQKFPVILDVVNGAVICPDCSAGLIQRPFRLNREQWQLLRDLAQTAPGELSRRPQPSSSGLDYPLYLEILLAHLNYHTEQTLQLKSLKMYLP